MEVQASLRSAAPAFLVVSSPPQTASPDSPLLAAQLVAPSSLLAQLLLFVLPEPQLLVFALPLPPPWPGQPTWRSPAPPPPPVACGLLVFLGPLHLVFFSMVAAMALLAFAAMAFLAFAAIMALLAFAP